MFPDYFRDDVFRLETQRLWLRWPTAADATGIEKLAGEREIAEFTARIPHPYPRGGAEGFVLAARTANAEGRGLHLALALRQKPGVAIGMVSLEHRMRPRSECNVLFGNSDSTSFKESLESYAVTFCLDQNKPLAH